MSKKTNGEFNTVNHKMFKRRLPQNLKDPTIKARKRYAISPQFQVNHKGLNKMVTRKVLSPEPTLSTTSKSQADNGQPFNVKDWLNSTYAKDTRKEFEFYLEKYGGNYKPGYGFQNLFESQDHKQGWSRFLSVIKDAPTDENVERTIKHMKGKKNVVQTVMNNKHKELLLQNENVLKFFVYNQLVAKKQGKEFYFETINCVLFWSRS